METVSTKVRDKLIDHIKREGLGFLGFVLDK